MPIKHAVHWYQQLPLTHLIGPIGGAVIGYFVSRRAEHRERTARQRTVAGALAAEVARIRTALGDDARDHRAPDPIFYGLTFEPPRVHPWLERVIVDGAEISPQVVTDFMALERELGHFATLAGQWREAAAVATAASATQQHYHHQRTPVRVAAIVGSSAPLGGPAAAAGADRARDRARALYDECVATQRMAVKVLDRLEATFAPVLASAPLAGPRHDGDAAAGSLDAPPPPPAAGPRPGARWRAVKRRIRRAGVTVLADFGLGDGWPEEKGTPREK